MIGLVISWVSLLEFSYVIWAQLCRSSVGLSLLTWVSAVRGGCPGSSMNSVIDLVTHRLSAWVPGCLPCVLYSRVTWADIIPKIVLRERRGVQRLIVSSHANWSRKMIWSHRAVLDYKGPFHGLSFPTPGIWAGNVIWLYPQNVAHWGSCFPEFGHLGSNRLL